ncbi:MAG: hypothetical protein MUF18_04770 [Fimbriiglobus sp.]|nr:hypothetical protein [Fimbriiglobus sp.]
MFQAPAWVPYRLRARWDQWRIEQAVAGLARTRPTPAADPSAADAELFLQVCRRDLRITPVAVKALLRFGPRLAVSFLDDGSLSEADREWVSAHVPNSRWLARQIEHPQLNAALAGRPRLDHLYRQTTYITTKLLYPILTARTEKVVVLDTDTAFFKRPDILVDWIASPDPMPALYLHDAQDAVTAVPPAVLTAFDDLGRAITPPGKSWVRPHTFFNSGLLAFRPEDCNLDVAEGYLKWRESAAAELKSGRPSIWFGDWTPEQTSYLCMFAVMAPTPRPFPADYVIGGAAGNTFNHFLRHHLVMADSLQRLKQLVVELP